MRWLGVMAVFGVALLARAAPAPRPTWADWVGDYEGKLAWKGCLTPGAARAKISLDAIDGAMFIDLIDAGGGLRAMSLVEEETRWSGQSGDVTLRVQRPRTNGLYLDAEVGSDCRLQANLVRATTKMEACDGLLGWARIENKCAKQVSERLEDFTALAAESRSWKPRAAGVTRMCEKRATKLVTSLLMAGCAPDPDPQAFVPGPNCVALDQALGKLRRCGNLPPDVMQGLDRLMSGPRSAPDATSRAVVERGCSSWAQELQKIAANSRCPL